MGHQGKLTTPAVLRTLLLASLTIVASMIASPGSARAQVGSARYSAIIVEARTGKIIMGVNQDEPRFPASLTKLMTLYMTFEALRDRRVQLTSYVPVSVWAAEQPPSVTSSKTCYRRFTRPPPSTWPQAAMRASEFPC